MKIRSLIPIVFSLLMTQAVFAGPVLSNCTNRAPITDGDGGFFTRFDCTFYPESAAYPFSLGSVITDSKPGYEYENWMTPSYLIFTTTPGDDTLGGLANWQDVLYFVPDQIADGGVGGGFDGSDQVILYWGASLTTSFYNTVTDFGNNNFGNVFTQAGQTYSDDPGNHTFTIDALPTPEPSTLLLVFGAGLGAFAVRRRRA